MKKISIILGVLLCIALVSAAIYTEPWNQNQRGGNHNLTEMDWISANYFNGTFTGGDVSNNMNMTDHNITGVDDIYFTGGGYIYDNGTALILGHS